jgi:hypothetical protein
MSKRVRAAAAVCAAFLGHAAFGSTIYTFTKLTPGGTVNEFNGGGINNNGVVAAEVNSHLFTYNIGANTYTNYNTIFPSQMGGVDDSGKVVYTSTTTVGSNTFFHGTVFDPSTNSTTTFDDPNAPQYTFANGVSGNGIITATTSTYRLAKSGLSRTAAPSPT